MTSVVTQEIRLKKMALVEALSAEIYGKLAEKNHANRDLWSKLKKEEEGHERIVTKFHDSLKEGKISVEHEDVTLHTLEKTCEFLELQLRVLNTKDYFSSADALSLAETVEDKTIDSIVFDAFTTKLPELEELLKRLKEESLAHRESIRKRKKTTLNLVSRILSFINRIFG